MGRAVALVKAKQVPAVVRPTRCRAPRASGRSKRLAVESTSSTRRPGVALTGEVDALGSAWNAASWVKAEGTDSAWVKGAWNGQDLDRHQVGQEAAAGRPVDRELVERCGVERPRLVADDFQARSWRGNSWKARSWREESWAARSWRDLT